MALSIIYDLRILWKIAVFHATKEARSERNSADDSSQ